MGFHDKMRTNLQHLVGDVSVCDGWWHFYGADALQNAVLFTGHCGRYYCNTSMSHHHPKTKSQIIMLALGNSHSLGRTTLQCRKPRWRPNICSITILACWYEHVRQPWIVQAQDALVLEEILGTKIWTHPPLSTPTPALSRSGAKAIAARRILAPAWHPAPWWPNLAIGTTW